MHLPIPFDVFSRILLSDFLRYFITPPALHFSSFGSCCGIA